MVKHPEKPKKGSFPLTPGCQVIVTGTKVDSTLAAKLREATGQNFFIGEWCSPSGEIGYLDAVISNIPSEELTRKLQELAQSFPTLDMAVSFMSNPPGTPGHPVVSFAIKQGKAKRDPNAHLGHGPPRRVSKG